MSAARIEEEKKLERKADFFKALSCPKRLIILLFLYRKGESTVKAMQEELKFRQSPISQHLKTLFYAGLVKRRKVGTCAFYELTSFGKEAVKLIEGKDGRL
jgi:DNA-binding transcriptional ArsR family regulator